MKSWRSEKGPNSAGGVCPVSHKSDLLEGLLDRVSGYYNSEVRGKGVGGKVKILGFAFLFPTTK